MTALTELLDELDALRAKATPGPWRPHGQALIVDERGVSLIATQVDRDDAALIVAAVNALPELVAKLRAVEALHQTVEIADAPGAYWCQHCQLQDDTSCPTMHTLADAVTTEVDR